MKKKYTITSSKTIIHKKITAATLEENDWSRILDTYKIEDDDVASTELESLVVGDVANELDIDIEPSGQNGEGTVSIYDNVDGDVILDNYDLQKWSNDILKLANDSFSLKDFKNKYKNWLENLIYG